MSEGQTYVTPDSFAPGSLSNIGRPTHITLGQSCDPYDVTSIVVYPDTLFLPFILANEGNIFDAPFCHISCDDCSNYWIVKNHYISRFSRPVCSNGKDMFDPTSFVNCK